MKKYLWVIVLLAVLVIPAWQIAAQDTTTEPLSMLDALAIVRDMVGTDLVLREVQYNADESCWKFEFTDLTEICISDTTGEVVDNPNDDDSPEATPEATPDTDDSADDNGTDDVIVGEATVTLEEAIAIALTIFPDSNVSKVELQLNDDGTLEWEIKLDDDRRSVEVNAETGIVLDFGYDDNNHSDDSNDDNGDNSGDDSVDDSNDDNSGSSHADDSNDDHSSHDDDHSGSDSHNSGSDDDESDDD